jgi:glutathione S-transferase
MSKPLKQKWRSWEKSWTYVYEERLSKCKYLAGENYSLADLQYIPSLVYFMKTTKANAVTSRPHVSAWWNDISSRPATVRVSANMKL